MGGNCRSVGLSVLDFLETAMLQPRGMHIGRCARWGHNRSICVLRFAFGLDCADNWRSEPLASDKNYNYYEHKSV